MPTISYAKVPFSFEFQRDSSVTLAKRSQDRILSHLDAALGQYHVTRKVNGRRNVILCDLFLTANYWLKCFREKHPAMKAGRYQAVLALFERVTYELQNEFGCKKLTEVPRCITEMLGRDLTEGGRKTDKVRNAFYYDELMVKKFRLRFRSGRVYRYESRPRLPVRLVPLNSEQFEQKGVFVLGASRLLGWGTFVMTVEREFYMSEHYMPGDNDSRQGIFHSAYGAAGTISAAGTMLVKNGQILGIRGDSGHYWPLLHNMAMVVTALSMHSVPLMPIRVLSFDEHATDLGSADDFVRSRLTWEEFEKARKDFRGKRLERIKAGKTYRNQVPQGNQPQPTSGDSNAPSTYGHSPL